jgi:hypothetical protein
MRPEDKREIAILGNRYMAIFMISLPETLFRRKNYASEGVEKRH